jgi:hypothetical protein
MQANSAAQIVPGTPQKVHTEITLPDETFQWRQNGVEVFPSCKFATVLLS